MAGRKTKLTPETQARIVDAIKVGSTYEIAAAYGGIAYNTLNEWLKAGEAATVGIFRDFYEAVKKAEGEAAVQWLTVIEKASTEQWQAAAWKLERRYPQQYGKQVQEVSGPDGGPLQQRTIIEYVNDWRAASDQ